LDVSNGLETSTLGSSLPTEELEQLNLDWEITAFSETWASVYSYQTRCNSREDLKLRQHRCENIANRLSVTS